MDLRQLDYFLKVAERGSITGAAAELKITQPSLTKSIRLLERELGVVLLQRLPRGVSLTDFGHSLARHAARIRVQIQDAVVELDGLRGGDPGTVIMGAGPAWLSRHLPQAVSRAMARRPGLRVYLQEGFDEQLLRALRDGEVELVLAELPEPTAAKDLRLLPMTTDELVVCCRSEHPLAERANIEARELLVYPWIMPIGRIRTQRRLEALLIGQDVPPPKPMVLTSSMSFLLTMLRLGDFLTYTRATTARVPEGKGLAILDVPVLATRRTAGVIHRRDAELTPPAAAIADELKAICALDPYN